MTKEQISFAPQGEEYLRWTPDGRVFCKWPDGRFVEVIEKSPAEPTARLFKPGDRVVIPATGTSGTILSVGSERAQVQYDHGPIREPMLSLLQHERTDEPASEHVHTFSGLDPDVPCNVSGCGMTRRQLRTTENAP